MGHHVSLVQACIITLNKFFRQYDSQLTVFVESWLQSTLQKTNSETKSVDKDEVTHDSSDEDFEKSEERKEEKENEDLPADPVTIRLSYYKFFEERGNSRNSYVRDNVLQKYVCKKEKRCLCFWTVRTCMMLRNLCTNAKTKTPLQDEYHDTLTMKIQKLSNACNSVESI